MKTLRLFTDLPLILLVSLLSANAASGQARSKTTVRAVAFPGSGIQDPLELYVGEGKDGLKVPLWGGKFTPEFPLPRMDVWRFGHWENGTDDSGKAIRVFNELARTKPPATSRVWLVFIESKSATGQTLRVSAIGADESALKEGGTLVLNLSPQAIGVQIGDKRAKVAPGKQAAMEPGSKRGQAYPVKFYFSQDDNVRPFVTTNWFHGERRKQLALVIQPTPDAPPKLLTIDDVASKQADEE